MEIVCIKCKTPKDKSQFHTDNRLKRGVKGRCKECTREFETRPHARVRRLRQSSEYIKRAKEKVTDNYVVRMLCHHNSLTPDDVRKFPELIKMKREIILTNRIIANERKQIKKSENKEHC